MPHYMDRGQCQGKRKVAIVRTVTVENVNERLYHSTPLLKGNGVLTICPNIPCSSAWPGNKLAGKPGQDIERKSKTCPGATSIVVSGGRAWADIARIEAVEHGGGLWSHLRGSV